VAVRLATDAADCRASAPVESSLRRLRRRIGLLDPGGAELVLRDLTDRVELRVGQDIRRRLDERERDEHHALRHRPIDPRRELDRAAPSRDPDRIARRHAEPAWWLTSAVQDPAGAS
jgi:hypothetical protein